MDFAKALKHVKVEFLLAFGAYAPAKQVAHREQHKLALGELKPAHHHAHGGAVTLVASLQLDKLAIATRAAAAQ